MDSCLWGVHRIYRKERGVEFRMEKWVLMNFTNITMWDRNRSVYNSLRTAVEKQDEGGLGSEKNIRINNSRGMSFW